MRFGVKSKNRYTKMSSVDISGLLIIKIDVFLLFYTLQKNKNYFMIKNQKEYNNRLKNIKYINKIFSGYKKI